MSISEAIAHFDEQVASLGALSARLPLLTYESADDLSCGAERASVNDLENHHEVIAALTEHARGRGCVVVHVTFDRAAYLAWLGHRPDNRGLRALWATEQVTF